MAERSDEQAPVVHGYGETSDCLCGRNFATVRGLREHLTKHRMKHHPRCYQETGVPADHPAGLCDCRILRLIDASTRPGKGAGE